MVSNTIENIQEAEETYNYTDSDQTKAEISAKNKRLRQSIEAMRDEIADEADYLSNSDD